VKHEIQKVSMESQLDRSIEELIGKLVDQPLTDAEETQLRQLVAQRSRKMRRLLPISVRQHGRLRLAG
jgi:hypothetical protein